MKLLLSVYQWISRSIRCLTVFLKRRSYDSFKIAQELESQKLKKAIFLKQFSLWRERRVYLRLPLLGGYGQMYPWPNQIMSGVSHQRKVASETTTFSWLWPVVPLFFYCQHLLQELIDTFVLPFTFSLSFVFFPYIFQETQQSVHFVMTSFYNAVKYF